MLLHGKFEDQRGVMHHVPCRPADGESREAIAKSARLMADAKGVQVVRVWCVYQLEEEIPCSS